MTLAQNLQADDHGNSQGRMVAGVTVVGDEKAHGSNLRRSNLSVSETIVPSETFLDPVPERDDPDVVHMGWRDEIEAAWKRRKPVYTLCGKLIYPPERRLFKRCRACEKIAERIREAHTTGASPTGPDLSGEVNTKDLSETDLEEGRSGRY
jgi:hypothetical protein